MKILRKFHPVTVTITFETEDEVGALEQVYKLTTPANLTKEGITEVEARKISLVISHIYNKIK